MIKTELARRVAQDNGYSYDIAKELVSATFKTLMDVISEGNEVNIYGFGVFGFTHLGERDIKNPKFGVVHAKPASFVNFRPCDKLASNVHDLTKEFIDGVNEDYRKKAMNHVKHLNDVEEENKEEEN